MERENELLLYQRGRNSCVMVIGTAHVVQITEGGNPREGEKIEIRQR